MGFCIHGSLSDLKLNCISQMNLKKKRLHPFTKFIIMLFFFGFEGLTWKGHGFLYPWFSFLPMSPCDEVFFRIPLVFTGCFFFSYLRWIILLSVFSSGSASSSVSASEVDMLLGSTTGF